MSRWAVVVPTCRPESFERFQQAWQPLLDEHDAHLIPVKDEPASWEWWPAWVPRQSDMCRSWGFYLAWEAGCEFTLSLDDDVLPQGDPFAAYETAFARSWPLSEYLSVGALTDTGREMRGFPYRDRDAECVVQYGGWHGVPDYDAATQLSGAPMEARFNKAVLPVPRGVYATCCAMNFAFKTEYTPLFWQLPLLEGRYNRFGDIWSGLLQKATLDALGKVMLVNGQASVWHERASDPHKNLQREKPGLAPNERIAAVLGGVRQVVPGSDSLGVYRGLSERLARFFDRSDRPYADHFRSCRDEWLALFKDARDRPPPRGSGLAGRTDRLEDHGRAEGT